MWDEEDGLFYDHILTRGSGGAGDPGDRIPLRVHSIVSLVPLFAVETIGVELLDRLPGFGRRFRWFMEHRPGLTANVSRHCREEEQRGGRLMLSLVSPERLRRILQKLLDETEFLSPYGVRSISRFHREHPYSLRIGGMDYGIDYQPGESTTGLFGGNSNWRGPIWIPMNYLLIESLQKFHRYLGDDWTVECPTGSGRHLSLWEVSLELSRRLGRIFARDPATGRRPVSAVTRNSRPTRTGTRTRCSTNISTPTPARPRRQSPDRVDGADRQNPATNRGTRGRKFHPLNTAPARTAPVISTPVG